MKIFISAGEPSGDLHGANLARALRREIPGVELVGFGGPRMAEAEVTLLFRLVDLAVMWFLRVLLNLHKFVGLLIQADRYFRDERPDALVLIDYPGFHWWLAKRAKARGIPVIYFVPPQLWAWAGWRVKKVRKYVDLLLCSLPFEPKWYRERGVNRAEYIGHPYFDELSEREINMEFLAAQRARAGRVVAILPGSRTQEIERNLPMMLRAAGLVAQSRRDVRFAISCLNGRHADLARSTLEEVGTSGAAIDVFEARTPELIRLADAAWAVSGSVGLELMNEALPSVIVYRIKPLDLMVARPFIKARFISLVNLLADAEVMPEYLTDRDVSTEMATLVLNWLNDPSERAKAASQLTELREQVARPGATARAAERIAAVLQTRHGARGPHFPTKREPQTTTKTVRASD